MQGAVDRKIQAHLDAQAVRYTTTRRRVIAALAAADGPRSAGELLDDLGRNVPLSSIYRTLTVLEGAGVLSPHLGAKGLTRYELAEWLTGHHHHLVCISCGAVDDIHLSEDVESALEGLVTTVTKRTRFAAVTHSLEIEGRCGRCA